MPAAREQRLVAADGNASSCPCRGCSEKAAAGCDRRDLQTGDRFLFLPFFLSHNL
jgi:hypothetical protein